MTADPPSMHAVVIERFGGVEQLEWRAWPLPEPQPGELRVRIRAVSVNPVDWKMRQGRAGGALPMILGRDCAGWVDAVGAGVSGFEVGQGVIGALLGPRSNGAYATHACAPAAFFGPRPETLTFAQAAALPVAGMTAYDSLIVKARIRAGDAVFIAGGTGGVGTFAIPLARRLGAETVLTSAGSEESADYLTRHLGVAPQHILRYRGRSLEDLERAVLGMNGGQPVSVAFDFAGGDMKRLCCRVVGFDGHVVTTVEEPPQFDLDVWSGGGSLLGRRSASLHLVSLGARARHGGPAEWSVYGDMLESLGRWCDTGHLPPPAVTLLGALSTETIRHAHTLLESGHARGKLVLTVDGDDLPRSGSAQA
jgi:NADPH:quinone reductase-like Zn-dependent oxidoreductase